MTHGYEAFLVQEGRDAYAAGDGLADCPYQSGDKRREKWLAGWQWGWEMGLKRADRARERNEAIATWQGQRCDQ